MLASIFVGVVGAAVWFGVFVLEALLIALAAVLAAAYGLYALAARKIRLTFSR